MWDMKFCGCYATVSKAWCFWPGACGVASEAELAVLLRELQQALPVPIHGVISGGQHAISNAVHAVLPGVPHQLCHFHYLREAVKPIYEADRHEKRETEETHPWSAPD
jgi:hypothetical protein